jgi:hypothetical protein
LATREAVLSEAEGRAIGEALLNHPVHELYDPALPGELKSAEALLKIRLPDSYRGFLSVGSGGVLATGDLLLGTKDPDQLGATLQDVAPAMWADGLPRTLLPFYDGERFLCLDLASPGGDEVVEVDPETFEVGKRLGSFPEFARTLLSAEAGDGEP